MPHVFLHEFITSGALAGDPLPPSLLREGTAMWRAIAADLLNLPEVTVVTTRDDRIPPLNLAGLTEHPVSDSTHERERFEDLCSTADRVLIIAPELGGELHRRVQKAIELAGLTRVWNSAALTAIASDKWATHQRLTQAGIPTIDTCLPSSDRWRLWDRPIAKPRDGAGSQGVIRLTADPSDLTDSIIIQPFIRGRWLSCSILFRGAGLPDAFPPSEQHIARDGGFAYLGGAMPATVDLLRIQRLAHQAINVVAEGDTALIGAVGVDFVEVQGTGELLVCEVNPRVTTSYIAARQLAQSNPLAGLLNPEAPPIHWNPSPLTFSATNDTPT